MLDDLDSRGGKEDLTDVWVEADAVPPVTHRITFFDVRPCPRHPDQPKARHFFGGAETICGIVVVPVTSTPSPGDHIEPIEDPPEIDCARCLTLMGWGGDLAAFNKAAETLARELAPHAVPAVVYT